MKFNKASLIIFMVLISLFAVGAVSASDSDNITDVMEISDDNIEIETIDVENEALSADEGNAGVAMNLAVENTTFDEQVIIDVTVVDTNKTVNFTESVVEIFIDEERIGDVPISPDGKSGCSLALGVLEVGTHYVKTNLMHGTDMIATNHTIFSVLKAVPVVTVENVSADVYLPVTIPVTVTDKNGKGVTGTAVVTIFWSGDSLSKCIKVVDGKGNATFDFTNILGIMSSMSMADMFGGMMGGSEGGMNWSEMFGRGGSGFNWTQMANMNWSEMFGGGGSGGMNWSEMFGGNESGNMMEGMMSVTFEYIFTPGKYSVNTTFLANRNYETANATSEFIVTYLEDVAYLADITVPKKIGDNTTVAITLLDKYSNPIPNVVVTAIMDGIQSINATVDENGTAKVIFANLVNGNHKLVLQSNANGSLTGKSFDFAVQLTPVNVTITAKATSVTAVDVNVDGKVGKYFTATLKDELGNPVSNRTVYISINNEMKEVTTDKNGAAKLQVNIAKAGTYTCSVVLLSDDAYNGAFEIAKVTVNKQTPKLTVAKKTYKANAKTKKFTATFKSAKGKAIKNKKITFKVKGKTYTAKTNSKGVATIKVKLTKKGTYKVTAKFAGDSTYKAVSKTGKLILK